MELRFTPPNEANGVKHLQNNVFIRNLSFNETIIFFIRWHKTLKITSTNAKPLHLYHNNKQLETLFEMHH